MRKFDEKKLFSYHLGVIVTFTVCMKLVNYKKISNVGLGGKYGVWGHNLAKYVVWGSNRVKISGLGAKNF